MVVSPLNNVSRSRLKEKAHRIDTLTFFDSDLAAVFQVSTLKGDLSSVLQTDVLQFQLANAALVENNSSRNTRKFRRVSSKSASLLLLIGIENFAILQPFSSWIGFGQSYFQGYFFFLQRVDVFQALLNTKSS